MSKIDDLKQDLKESWNNVRGQDAFIPVVLGAAGALILITVIIGMVLQPEDRQNGLPDGAVYADADLPAGYLDPFPPRPEVKPEVREVIKYIERDPEPEKEYKPSDIMTFLDTPDQQIDPNDRKRAQIKSRRKKSSYIWKREKDKYSPYDYQTEYEDQSEDMDFSAHKEPKSTPTYPVDLSRVFTADRFIPVTLINEIKSELPSQKVLAQVESDIFASHGRKILIPRGSRAVGSYEPLDARGQTRLQIVWDRIITPDGINIKFESETADQQGSSGITGEVDNRTKDRYGSALLFSSISALAQLTVSAENEQQAAAADSFTQEFGTITAELLRESLDVVPRVTIERGTRLLISPLTDLWFKDAIIGEVQVVKMKGKTQ